MERIQKIISDHGLASRREAERMIAAGRVRVNGLAAVTGQKADPKRDKITIDGRPLALRGKRVYLMLYKPRGYVTTSSDERGRKTVLELVSGISERVYPVGRLDMNSEGLLLMTNDGELANKLTHPSYSVPKCYNVRVRGADLSSAITMLNAPMNVEGVHYQAAKARVLEEGESALLSITISEGKNRQIRKMCEAAGLEVLRLKRVSQGKLSLGSLKSGQWRHLSANELRYLQEIE